MTFTVSEKQEAAFKAWREEHYKTCRVRPDSFGSLNRFIFFPSGIGDSVSVDCPCGAVFHLESED